MSVEAPRNSGQGELIHPQRREGSFRRFLRKLFDVPLEQQHKLIQPPAGMEDFVARIQQEMNNYPQVQPKQQALEKLDAGTDRLVIETAKQKQNDLEQKRLMAQMEAQRVMKELQIKERLEYICNTVWEGKGKIQPVESMVDSDGYGILGGLELIHSFPSCVYQEEHRGCTISNVNGDPFHTSELMGRLAPEVGNTRLSVALSKRKMDPRFKIEVKGDITGLRYPAEIVMDTTQDRIFLLEKALIEDSHRRITNGCLPSEVEKRAGEELSRARKFYSWMNWTAPRNTVSGTGKYPFFLEDSSKPTN